MWTKVGCTLNWERLVGVGTHHAESAAAPTNCSMPHEGEEGLERWGHDPMLKPRHPARYLPPAKRAVLGRFLYSLNQFCQEEYGIHHEISEFFIYEYKQIWKCSQEESTHRVHSFFKHPLFLDGIPVIPGAFEALTRLSDHCDLVVVTSRQHAIQDVTLEWIDRHFPGLFQEVYFGNHFALHGASRSKSEICK
jgi:hypothetical protein